MNDQNAVRAAFHEAWGKAKEQPDYNKDAWGHVQKYLENPEPVPERVQPSYMYLVSYVKTQSGGMHDHHSFRNRFVTLDHPMRKQDIKAIEGESIYLNLDDKNTSVTVMSFQRML